MAISGREQVVAWVQAARRGDRAAFGRLVRKFQDAVAGVVLARLGPGPDVEDVAQEAFVAAYRRLADLREPARFGSWVCGIARNLALRWLRDRRRAQALPGGLPARGPAESSDLAERVMAAVARLQERLREPLTLYYIDGYTTHEVAELLGLPPGTVRRRLYEARTRLRTFVEATMKDEIKRSAPAPNFAQAVLDRIAGVRVMGWGTDGHGRVLLITDEAGRSFSMFVGDREAQALAEALGQAPPGDQPLLYDLMIAVSRHFEVALQRVSITELKAHVFHARIDLTAGGGEVSLDARPSDALNLALRAGIEMQVAREVTKQAAPDFANPRPVEELVRVCAARSIESMDQLRQEVSAEPKDTDARLRLGSLLVRSNIHASYRRPWPLSPEGMADRAAKQLAEARELLSAVLAEPPHPEQRREALLWLGTLAYLEGDWQATIQAFEQHAGPWAQLDWSVAFHLATALCRSGRHEESLRTVGEAVAAINRVYGPEPGVPGRLVARATLAELAGDNLGDLTAEARYRALFEPVEPPCILFAWSAGPPFQYGPAFLLTGRALTIGSGPDADILVSDPQCDPVHARVYPVGKQWHLEDLGSSTGTWSAKRFEKPQALHTGMRIQIGEKRGRSNALVFFSLRECLNPYRPPRKRRRAWFVDIAGDHPWYRAVPLVETFRREKSDDVAAGAQGKTDGAREMAAELRPGAETPACAGWPTPWPLCRIALSDEPKPRLTLTGREDREAVLSAPVDRLNTLRLILSGGQPQRPMTEHLAARLLEAAGLTCREVVIGPSDDEGPIIARLHICGRDRDAWLDANPIDAIGVAFALQPVPPIWACGAHQ